MDGYDRERKIFIRAVYHLLNSIDRQTSLEIRENLLYPGRVYFDKRRTGVGFWSTAYDARMRGSMRPGGGTDRSEKMAQEGMLPR